MVDGDLFVSANDELLPAGDGQEVVLCEAASPQFTWTLGELDENVNGDDKLAPLEELIDNDMTTRIFASEHAATDAGDDYIQQGPEKQRNVGFAACTRKPSTSDTQNAANPRRSDPNKARQERKQELVYLRSQVADLEHHHLALQRRKKLQQQSFLRSRASSLQDHDARASKITQRQSFTATTAAVAVWQQIAKHQYDQRAKSERENVRLRLMLENQVRVAKNLERVINTTMLRQGIHNGFPRKNRHHHFMAPTIATERVDAAIFDDLLRGVRQSYAELDSVFQGNGLCNVETFYLEAQLRNDESLGRMHVEIAASTLFPFDLHSTGAAVWNNFLFFKEQTPSRFYYERSPKFLDASEDTIVDEFVLELHAKNTTARFRVKQIIQRFFEADRIVVVSRAYCDPIQLANEPVSGVRFLEKGYFVIKRPTTISGTFTLLQPCFITIPMQTSEGGVVTARGHDGEIQMGPITDFVLHATTANVTESHQMIENVLLEQAMTVPARAQKTGSTLVK
uniref:START domain-containing protein n=1 Tax=Globisporangium ultimum (strain ATCC 200006 / CBS 805.95 / DAOM BR144) TaxID=431595 RepID=K3W8R9_GLOUD